MTTFENLCLLVNIIIETSSVDPDQTVPTGAIWSGYTLFVKEASDDNAYDFLWYAL